VLAPGVVPELIKEGFAFIGGPVGAADGGLYFSDIRANKIYFLNQGGISVVREKTNGANGLALMKDKKDDKDESLLFASGKRIAKRNNDGSITTVLSEEGPHGPQLAPSDLIADTNNGGIYFTAVGSAPTGPAAVFYLHSDNKTLSQIDDAVPKPSGLTLTKDGKTLFVTDAYGAAVFAYDVSDVSQGGMPKNKRQFLQLHGITPGKRSSVGGIAIDDHDRLYIATLTGVQVFDSLGGYIGTIRAGRQPTNVAFGGPDKQTLYITAREALYSVKTLAKGPDRPGK
jgi:gluconolactonase